MVIAWAWYRPGVGPHDWLTLAFVIGGVLLMASEVLVPGLVVIFIGAGAVLTGLLRYLELVESVPLSMLAWIGLSIALVAALRSTVRKWFPPDESVGEVDEDLEAYGEVVEVVDDVPEFDEGREPGRIRLDGSTWPAWSVKGALKTGASAKLVYRKNLDWYVEPVPVLDEPKDDAVPAIEEAREKKES